MSLWELEKNNSLGWYLQKIGGCKSIISTKLIMIGGDCGGDGSGIH